MNTPSNLPTVLLPRRVAVFLVPAVALLLGGAPAARAAKEVFERTKPHVTVWSIGEVEVRVPPTSFFFFAELQTGPRGTAFGPMRFGFPDGSRRDFRAVAGTVEGNAARDGFQWAFVLLPQLASGELDPTKPLAAVARPHPSQPDCIIWDIKGSDLHEESVQFDVAGTIQRAPGGSPPPSPHPWFGLLYPQQRVTIIGTDLAARFRAAILGLRDHRGHGWAELRFPEEAPLRFEPLFTTTQRTSETGPAVIIILMALEGAPLRLENLFTTTVRPDPAVPGCDIWSFMGNGVSDTPHVEFDAQGRKHFFR